MMVAHSITVQLLLSPDVKASYQAYIFLSNKQANMLVHRFFSILIL